MQAPLATRASSGRRQEQQHLVPNASPLLSQGRLLRLGRAASQNRSSASSRHRVHRSQHPPHCRGRHNRSSASSAGRPAASAAPPRSGSSGNSDRGRGAAPSRDGDRLAPSQFCESVDLAQVQQRPLHHTALRLPGDSPRCSSNRALCRPSCAWCDGENMTPRMIPRSHPENGLGLHYSRFSPILLTAPFPSITCWIQKSETSPPIGQVSARSWREISRGVAAKVCQRARAPRRRKKNSPVRVTRAR